MEIPPPTPAPGAVRETEAGAGTEVRRKKEVRKGRAGGATPLMIWLMIPARPYQEGKVRELQPIRSPIGFFPAAFVAVPPLPPTQVW